MIKTAILSLNGATVTSMYPDGVTGSVLVALSDGRILKIDEITMLASLAGDRILSAQVVDGFGSVSMTGSTSVLYALHNRIIEINKVKEQVRWKEVVEPFSATSVSDASGVFTSPVMWGGQDFGYWKNLQWECSRAENTGVSVYARVAFDSTSIFSEDWQNMSTDPQTPTPMTTITKSMDGFNNKGGYLQLKMVLKTSASDKAPVVTKLTASYEAKFSVYFFTQKFIMKQGSNASDMFLTGTYSMPQNTEVKFGIAPAGSCEWNDYTVIEPNKLTSLPPGTSERFRMGIKLSSWDDSASPSVDEFAVIIGADKDNLLNGGG